MLIFSALLRHGCPYYMQNMVSDLSPMYFSYKSFKFMTGQDLMDPNSHTHFYGHVTMYGDTTNENLFCKKRIYIHS